MKKVLFAIKLAGSASVLLWLTRNIPLSFLDPGSATMAKENAILGWGLVFISAIFIELYSKFKSSMSKFLIFAIFPPIFSFCAEVVAYHNNSTGYLVPASWGALGAYAEFVMFFLALVYVNLPGLRPWHDSSK